MWSKLIPIHARNWPNAVIMLSQYRRRWSNIQPTVVQPRNYGDNEANNVGPALQTLVQRLVLARNVVHGSYRYLSQQTQDVHGSMLAHYLQLYEHWITQVEINEMNRAIGHFCAHMGLIRPEEPPEDGEMSEMTLTSRYRIRNSNPRDLRPSPLPLDNGGSPQYFLLVDEKKHFCFFQTAKIGKRTPNCGVKCNGANHYPMSVAHPAHTSHRPNVSPSSTTSAQHWFNVSWLLGTRTPSLFINTTVCVIMFDPFTAGAAYIWVLIFY